ncbi:MAG: bifunctional hydroxymethylpyrimidine kinase/phosphomethylpyrimidine kinase, partial [Gaiellaceae bacterium]
MVPRCLTIAGSDSGGGAGIQADLKTFAHLGCHGMSAIVALTAQNTRGVTGITEAPAEFIEAELEAVFSDIGVDAAKTGMLFSVGIVETVCDFLERNPVPLVVDPVLVASSGAQLIQPDAAALLISRLMPLAAVVTPNLPEACALAGRPYEEDADREELAEVIHGFGPAAVLVTGGHGSESVDWLYNGKRHVEI